MGLVTLPSFGSDPATVTAAGLDGKVDPLATEFNGNIENVNIKSSAAITYSKLSLTGSILNADISSSASIADTKLAQITTALKVHGTSITGLASLPAGAGIVPIANLASGTPTGYKYIRDDGTLQPILAGSGSTLTIASGVVTATTGYHLIDTESAAASDDLDTISGGTTGQVLIIRAANDSRTVVAKTGTGNLRLSADCTLDADSDTLTLVFAGTNWLEIARSNNGS